MVRMCPECERTMDRDTSSGAVIFICYCGRKVPGGPADARIAGEVYDAGETQDMYKRLVKSAPHDRVNQLVSRDCPECGLDYMTQIRVGDREVVIWICKCGFVSGTAEPENAAASGPGGAGASA